MASLTQCLRPRNERIRKARLLAELFRLGAQTQGREARSYELCDKGAHPPRAWRGMPQAEHPAPTAACQTPCSPLQRIWVRFGGEVQSKARTLAQDREGTFSSPRAGPEKAAQNAARAQKIANAHEGLKARRQSHSFLVTGRHYSSSGQEWPTNCSPVEGGKSRGSSP